MDTVNYRQPVFVRLVFLVIFTKTVHGLRGGGVLAEKKPFCLGEAAHDEGLASGD